MSRIARTVSTIAVVVATAALAAPAAQAQADGLYPHVGPQTQVTMTIDRGPLPHAVGDRGAWVHDTPLANPVDGGQTTVTGRAIATDGGTDWTFPVMGAIAFALVLMILGERALVRRGRLAT